MAEGFPAFPPNSLALVTGATGFTGSVLVRELIARGVRVRALARPSSSVAAFDGLPIEWIRGQVYDPAIIASAVEGVNYVFHVAAAYREAKIADEDYYRVHLESTQHLLHALQGKSSLKRFVHVSTVGVHGHIENPPADENAPFAPGDTYQRSKAEAEIWLRENAPRLGIPFSVVRPAAIYGPGDKRLLKVFKLVKKPVFPVLGFGKCLYHLIHVEDLVQIFLLAATHPDADGQVFIAGNSNSVTLVQMGKIIADELRADLRVIRIPAFPFFILGALCEVLWKPLGKEPPIYRRRVAFFTKDRSFNTAKVHRVLNFQERYDNEAGLRMTTDWYRDNNWL